MHGPGDDVEHPRRRSAWTGELSISTRIIEVIKRNHPDLVALQEVDLRRQNGAPRSAFAVLQRGGRRARRRSKIDHYRRTATMARCC